MKNGFIKFFSVILALGAVMCTIAFIGFGGFVEAFEALNNRNDADYQIHEEVIDDFSAALKISTDLRNKEINFSVSPDEKAYITYYSTIEEAKQKDVINYSYTDGIVSLASETEPFKWNFMFFNWHSATIDTVTIKLPAGFNGEIDVSTTNGEISVDNYNLSSLVLKTTNAKITVNTLTAKTADFVTTNGKIETKDIATETLKAVTTNSSASAENITASNSIELISTNGKLDLINIASPSVKAATTNSNISASAINCSSVVLTSSNGKINAAKINASEKLSASTTNSSVVIDEISAPILEVNSSNGSLNCTKIVSDSIKLNTTNSSISLSVLSSLSEYKTVVRTSNNSVILDGQKVENGTYNSSAAKLIECKTSNGKIVIDD